MKYESVTEKQKLQVLREHLEEIRWKSLDEKAWCLHCDKQFAGKDVRVYRDGGDLFLGCGTPGCDKSPLDWARQPWWRPSAARQQVPPEPGDLQGRGGERSCSDKSHNLRNDIEGRVQRGTPARFVDDRHGGLAGRADLS